MTRRLRFTISPAVPWLIEALLRRRLEREVPEEIRLTKQYLEAQAASAPGR